jgi:DNA-binding Lrp family transcriptional regulator
VQQIYYITGDADFCLICTAKSIEDFEAFTRRLFYKGSNVARFRTSVVMSRRKTGSMVHIAEP